MKFLHTKNQYLFPLLLLILTILLYLIFEPKVSATLFPLRSKMLRQTFLSDAQRIQTIDPKAFWQFREFYSPGSYSFNRNGLDQKLDQQSFDISLNASTSSTIKPFLIFTSPKLISYDFLISSNLFNSLNQIVIPNKNTHSVILINNKNTLLFSHDDGVTLAFIQPEKAMEKANGFFDYKADDKQFVQNKVWLDITEIKY